ncbi:unnamed protein product [Linum tenue]|uniref:Uncharacterized protein n=1 Tax=Linum tenue TaxID=586396 RepID=A0AAV0HU94_9ROSI|nr:unnamed protein product [Linum tenue]
MAGELAASSAAGGIVESCFASSGNLHHYKCALPFPSKILSSQHLYLLPATAFPSPCANSDSQLHQWRRSRSESTVSEELGAWSPE